MEDQNWLVEFIKSNWVGIVIIVVISGSFLYFQDDLAAIDARKKLKRAERLTNLKDFVVGQFGTLEVVDNFYSDSSVYSANVSVDLSKPMLLVKCRPEHANPADDKCWVVKELN